ncbi:hypothetical protein Mapa_010553 [Marchantia paleacea]|nr:hypothetical protein Mapa_010553 [Marchantia paleacea]
MVDDRTLVEHRFKVVVSRDSTSLIPGLPGKDEINAPIFLPSAAPDPAPTTPAVICADAISTSGYSRFSLRSCSLFCVS